MKRKVMLSLFVIFLAAAIIGGATMAWFTAKADAPENVFTAGTVMIEAGDEFVWGGDMGNVNPGDCFAKCIQIYNTGTKNIELRLDDVGFAVEIDWDYLWDNWDALCYSSYGERPEKETDAWQEWQAEVLGENPAFLAPCPDSGWAMRYVKDDGGVITGFEFYYKDGPIAPGEVVELCVVVVFDGPLMNNVWQAAEWKQLNGQFNAVQASNDAPEIVWEDLNWNWAAGKTAEQALRDGTSNPYANYFYDNEGFKFSDCCLNTARVYTQAELIAALADEGIERIKLYGEFDGFTVNRSVAIQGGIINVGSTSGSLAGVYLNTNGTVVIDGVTIIGQDVAQERGILTQSGTNPSLSVRNSSISGVATGIYLNPLAATLTATNNSIYASAAGIGTDNADLTGNISGNTFDPGVEGIGLNQPVKSDGTVMTQAEANALAAILSVANGGATVNVYGY